MTATDTTRTTATAEGGNSGRPSAGMKKQAPPATPASGERRMASAADTKHPPDGIAISPAISPLPPIYLPRPGEPSSTGLLCSGGNR